MHGDGSAGWGRPSAEAGIGTARALRRTMTPQEAKLWLRLRALRGQGIHVCRQVPIDRYVVDFACSKERIVIEVDGGGHGHDAAVRLDRMRDGRLADLGYRVLRFWNAEVDANPNAVIDTILGRIDEGRSERSSA